MTPFVPPDMRHVPLPVVYRDEHIIVVDKPAGLLAVPGRGAHAQDCVARRVAELCPQARGPFVAHRLDMDTSGLMVLGLSAESQRHLSAQFEAHSVTKVYVALLAGKVEVERGQIELPFRLDPNDRPRQVYDPVHGKPGRTRFEVIAFEPGFAATRVRFWPQTGRTHQLRLHAAHPLGLGHAILGDRLYGDVGSAPRLMLHAERVTLVHPQRGDTVGFCAPVPF